jgi:hypothetical protein
MAHPMAGQAKASQKRRLASLQAHAGKSHGSSSMYKKTSYPKKNAGSSTPMTISGGSAKKRPDRYAAGGAIGGGKKRRPHATTNIIISHAGGRGGTGGGGGASPSGGPVPVPVPRPVPVPVGGGGPPPIGPGGPAMGGLPVRPPIAAGPGGLSVRPPVGPPPVGAGPPPVGPPPGIRPPGMKAGGAVKKAAKGGFLRDSPGKAYRGFPHSPTTSVDDAVSAHKAGGQVKGGVGKHAEGGEVESEITGLKHGGSAEGVAVEGKGHGLPGGGSAKGVAVEGRGHGYKKGGPVDSPGGFRRPGNLKGLAEKATYGGRSEKKSFVKKRQMGGGLGMPPMGQGGLGLGGGQSAVAPPGGGGLLGAFPGRGPVPEQKGPPTVSGRPMIPTQPLTVPQPKLASSALQKPAPGTTVGYKKGGFTRVHGDEPEDRKLIGKVLKEKGIAKRKEGGFVPKNQDSKDPGLERSTYHNQGKGYAAGGSVQGSAQAGAGSGMGRLAHSKGKWPQSRKGEG